MEKNNKVQMRFSVSAETAERIRSLSKKFHVRPNIAVEMAVYSMDNFGKRPLEIDQRLDRMENAIAFLISELAREDI